MVYSIQPCIGRGEKEGSKTHIDRLLLDPGPEKETFCERKADNDIVSRQENGLLFTALKGA